MKFGLRRRINSSLSKMSNLGILLAHKWNRHKVIEVFEVSALEIEDSLEPLFVSQTPVALQMWLLVSIP